MCRLNTQQLLQSRLQPPRMACSLSTSSLRPGSAAAAAPAAAALPDPAAAPAGAPGPAEAAAADCAPELLLMALADSLTALSLAEGRPPPPPPLPATVVGAAAELVAAATPLACCGFSLGRSRMLQVHVQGPLGQW